MHRCDLVVVGAGPAGVAAAVTAAEHGSRVVVVDDSPGPGGQIWRAELGEVPPRARPWIERLRSSKVRVLSGTSVWWPEAPGRLATTAGSIEAEQTIMCCGAREVFLPFPGWHLPGVMGAGGLQAMAASGLDLRDCRVVLAGSGPLLLQVAHKLAHHGAKVLRIAEQAPFSRLLRFAMRLGTKRATQAVALSNHRLRCSSWPLEAFGENHVQGVRLCIGGRDEELACDYLGVGFGLVPNLELALAFGCRTEDGAVAVNEQQRTSVDGVFAAGEICGVKGAPGAIADGVCAAHEANGLVPPGRWRRRRDRERRFASRMAKTFALRHQVRQLGREDTLFCRCEEVPLGQVAEHADWTSAKLHSRCGMGLCQGRICGTAARTIFGWEPCSSRPPLVPIAIRELVESSTGDSPAQRSR